MATNYQFGIRLQVEGENEVVAATDKAARGVKEIGEKAVTVGDVTDKLYGKLKNLAAAYVGVQAVREFVQTADAMNALDGRLRNVITTSGDYTEAQKSLYAISQRNNVGLQETTTLLTRIYDPITKMGGGVREATLMVDALSTGLRNNAATQAESNSAILQFSQAMASGVLRGEEYNAVNEAAPGFMRALADALGVTQGKLREMAEAGELTADVVGNAMPAAMAILTTQAQGLPETVGGAFSDLKNDASLLVQEIDKTTGATSGLAEMIVGASGLVQQFTGALRDSKSGADLAGSGFDGVAVAIGGVGFVVETALVLFATVKSTLLGVGREIGAVAAQLSLLASIKPEDGIEGLRSFARQWTAIGDAAKSDGVAARAELDRYTGSIVGSTTKVLAQRDALKNNSISTSENTAEMLKLSRQNDLAGGGYTKLTTATGASEKATKAAKDAAKDAAAEVKKQDDAYASLIDSTRDAIQKSAEQRGETEKLTTAQKFVIDVTEKVRDKKIVLTSARSAEIGKLVEEMDASDALNTKKTTEIQIAKDRNAQFDTDWDKSEKDRLATEGRIGAARTMLEKIEAETAAIGKSKSELALMTIEREAERAGVVKGTEAYDAFIQKIRDAVVKKEQTEASIGEMKKIEDEAKRSAQQIEQSMTDSLFRAFESGEGFWSTLWDGVVNTVKTTILKPIIQDTVKDFLGWFKRGVGIVDSTVMKPTLSTTGITSWLDTFAAGFKSLLGWLDSALGGWLSTAWNGISAVFGGGKGGTGAGGAGGLASNASTANTLYNLVNGSAAIYGSSAAYGAALGTTSIGAGSQAAMLAAQTGEFGLAGLQATWGAAQGAGAAGAATGAGTGTAAGAGAGAGSVAAVAVPLAAIALGLYGMTRNDDGETRINDRFVVDPLSGAARAVNDEGVFRLKNDIGLDGGAAAALAAARATNDILDKLQSSSRIASLGAGVLTNDRTLGMGGVYAGGALTTGAKFGDSGQGFVGSTPSPEHSQFEAGSRDLRDFAETAAAFQLDLMQASIQALQAVEDLPAEIKDYVRAYDAEKLGMTDAAGMLARVAELAELAKQAKAEADAAIEAAKAPTAAAEVAEKVSGSMPDFNTSDWSSSMAAGSAGGYSDGGAELVSEIKAVRADLARALEEQTVEVRAGSETNQTLLLKLLNLFDRMSLSGTKLQTTDEETVEGLSSVRAALAAMQAQLDTLNESVEAVTTSIVAVSDVEGRVRTVETA